MCYFTYGGNTKEVAEIAHEELSKAGYETQLYRITGSHDGFIPDIKNYDLILLGSFTWGKGGTPLEVKNFVAEVGYKPNNIAIFGTGDTQFGGLDNQLYCRAVDRLSDFYESKYPVLKVEQSPRGREHEVKNWIERIVLIDAKES